MYLTVYFSTYEPAPMFWGTLSDYKGRRPIMIACLITLSLSCVGLALVPTSDYWLLMLLRCFQAAGSASTYAVGTFLVVEPRWLGELIMSPSGAGIISDISTRAERAGFVGLYGLGPLVRKHYLKAPLQVGEPFFGC